MGDRITGFRTDLPLVVNLIVKPGTKLFINSSVKTFVLLHYQFIQYLVDLQQSDFVTVPTLTFFPEAVVLTIGASSTRTDNHYQMVAEGGLIVNNE